MFYSIEKYIAIQHLLSLKDAQAALLVRNTECK